MFVEIDNNEMNVFDIEKLINTTRDANGGIITPDFAMEILSKTNHFGHIKKVLKHIKEKCKTAEEIAPYKEFILSCVDGREISPQAMEILQNLVEKCDEEFQKEFAEVDKKRKIFRLSDCKVCYTDVEEGKFEFEGYDTVIFYSTRNNISLFGPNYEFPKVLDVSLLNSVTFHKADVSNVENFRFKKDGLVQFEYCEKFNKKISLSSCKILDITNSNLTGIEELKTAGIKEICVSNPMGEFVPSTVDLSSCDKLSFKKVDFDNFDELKIKEGAEAVFDTCSGLPSNLGISSFRKFHISNYSLSRFNDVSFRDGADIALEMCRNFPKGIDVSMCNVVSFRGSNLENIDKLKFRKNAEVHMQDTKNLPSKLNFDECKKVYLCNASLANVEELILGKCEYASFNGINGFPEVFDVAECDTVEFARCMMYGIKKLRFKDGAKVYFTDAKYLLDNIDVSNCSVVDFKRCDLQHFNKLRFRDGAEVSLFSAMHLPKDIDFSNCSEVDLGHSDVSKLDNLKFGEGAKVTFNNNRYQYSNERHSWPENMDVSKCDTVDFSHCFFYGDEKIKFKDGAKVIFYAVKELHKGIDFSNCSEVNLRSCDLKNLDEIKFRKGAKVDIRDTVNLPEVLDVSMCEEVVMYPTHLNGVREIKFKNEEQRKNLCGDSSIRGDGEIKITYTDDEKKLAPVLGKVNEFFGKKEM